MQCRAMEKDYSLFDIVTGISLFAPLSPAFHIAHSSTPLSTDALYLTYCSMCIDSKIFSKTYPYLVLVLNFN